MSNAERSLIDRLRALEDTAIEEIYKVIFPKFWAYVNKRGGNMEDARDIFQEQILKFLEIIQEEGKVGENFKGYFFKMLINKWMRNQKKKKNEPDKFSLIKMEEHPETTNKIEFKVNEQRKNEEELSNEKRRLYELIDGFIENAKSDDKKILIDFYYLNKPLATIAEEMGLSPSYIRVKKGRLIERMRGGFDLPQLIAN